MEIFYFDEVEVSIFLCPVKKSLGFPGGSVVKNPPANAGDTGSIPDQGRFHKLGGS